VFEVEETVGVEAGVGVGVEKDITVATKDETIATLISAGRNNMDPSTISSSIST
jgi:hypothetical protein